MCELHDRARNGALLSRRDSMRWAILAVAALIALATVLLRATHGGERTQRSPLPADRVFEGDMARQTADARRLLGSTVADPAVAALGRQIVREDRRSLTRSVPVPAGGDASRRRDVRAVRQALRRHIEADRIIADVALGSRSGSQVRRAAARLRDLTHRWATALR